MNQWSKFVVGAVVTGFLASQVAVANDAAPAGDGAAKKAEKASCNSCKGKAKGKKAKKGKEGCGNGCPSKEGEKPAAAEGEAHPEKH